VLPAARFEVICFHCKVGLTLIVLHGELCAYCATAACQSTSLATTRAKRTRSGAESQERVDVSTSFFVIRRLQGGGRGGINFMVVLASRAASVDTPKHQTAASQSDSTTLRRIHRKIHPLPLHFIKYLTGDELLRRALDIR
jgi:hypothetical protein